MNRVDEDIMSGRIEVYSDKKLKEQFVFKMFENYVKENRILYGSGDLGEVYAISLAQTIGAYSLVTDDIKHGGPYMSLLQFDDDVMPLTFADILILRYLLGNTDVLQMVKEFNAINDASNLKWILKRQLVKFIKRFWTDPYKNGDKEWMQKLVDDNQIKVRSKFEALDQMI